MPDTLLGSRVIIMYYPPDMVPAFLDPQFYLYPCLEIKHIRELSIANEVSQSELHMIEVRAASLEGEMTGGGQK